MLESRKETILFALEKIHENINNNNGNPEEILFYLRKLVHQVPLYLIGTRGIDPAILVPHKRKIKSTTM
jgi:hypothetical protein